MSFFQLIPSAPTGVAIVEVTPDAENHIVLALSPATELTAALDLLVCDEHEAAAILGRHHAEPTIAAQELRGLGLRVAVVTAGARGAAYSTAEHTRLVPAPHVHAIDTTGAGDQFLGTLTARLTQNTPPLGRAVADAVSAATAVVRGD